MNHNDRLKQAKEKAKETADKLFKEKPEEIRKILEDETTLGSPDNLIDRDDDEDEQKND